MIVCIKACLLFFLDALSEIHQVIYENGGPVLKDLCPPLQCGEDYAV